jgi:FO synthase
MMVPARLGGPLSWSPSLTITLTYACPWHCRYCGFRRDGAGLVSEAEVEAALDRAQKLGAYEVLLISGEAPDSMPRIRSELRGRGHAGFLDFAVSVARRALSRGLLPHSNFGALGLGELRRLREVNASLGLMLENADDRFNRAVAPEKSSRGRLRAIEAAGKAQIPFTSGILIGLGETQRSRLESLRLLARLHGRYGHLQEVLLQSFVPNAASSVPPASPPPAFQDYLELIARWREWAPQVPIQIPPNIHPFWRELLPFVDDLGGISPEGDVVNPRHPWAPVETYAAAAQECGRALSKRLPVYPRFLAAPEQWLDPAVVSVVARHHPASLPAPVPRRFRPTDDLWSRPTDELRQAADALNRRLHGATVTYVVNRNANFTNICHVGCAFCGFQRRAADADAYIRSPEEVVTRLAESPEITEVCIQGGIHPGLGLDAYTELLKAIRRWKPDIHIHAFSPMEIESLRRKTGRDLEWVLGRLRDCGLDTIPGTAAEILDDEIRSRISSRKLGSSAWVEIIRTAHRMGIRSTATVMYGHVETWDHLRAHFELLLRIQEETGGFTELVPLQFVPYENPLGRHIRPDPEDVRIKTERLYPLARLFFGATLPNLQTSWVKLGPQMAVKSLGWGCNDFGGTLFEESITRASGGRFGSALSVSAIETLIREGGKIPRQRATIY